MLSNVYKNIIKVEETRKVYFEEKSAEEVWRDVMAKDHSSMQALCTAMSKLVYEVGVPKWLVHMSANILYHTVYRWWGHFTHESDYLAHQFSGMSPSLMAFLQRQYTLAHMGCSVVMAWDEKDKQMLCFRSLDWKGSDDIAKSTRKFSFINRADEEVAQIAGITAMVGVLTGVKKGFSIAINYAPWKRSARFKSDPTFLIRKLLEDEGVNSYTEALQEVQSWETGSPCFISLCGVEKGEACVVELGHKGVVHVRYMDEGGLLIQTNHYDLQGSPFIHHNEAAYSEDEVAQMDEQQWYDSELLRNSQQRYKLLDSFMQETKDVPMPEKLVLAYKQVPVLNWETAQWVLMKPSMGELDVYACTDK